MSNGGAFAQDRGAAGSGGGGDVRGARVDVLVGQDGEGDGFLGVGIDAVGGGGRDGKVREKFAEAAHDLAIVDASAGGDQLLRRGVGADGVGDGSGGKFGGGGDEFVEGDAGGDEAA